MNGNIGYSLNTHLSSMFMLIRHVVNEIVVTILQSVLLRFSTKARAKLMLLTDYPLHCIMHKERQVRHTIIYGCIHRKLGCVRYFVFATSEYVQ